MKFTETYRLASMEAGEPMNVLEDSRRFLTIDRQLLGLFQVFGNGVISGWTVVSGGGLSVSVSAGRGHVAFVSGETTVSKQVGNLPKNSTVYIYAQITEITRFNRDVDFFASTTLFDNGRAVLLSKLTTNDNSVTSLDDSVRNDISFIEQIKSLINSHRHRGGSDHPSKIDLSSEVMGKLPGFRLDNIDASKITTGRIPVGRVPVLEHSDLQHSGILTHAQLDTFVRNLSNPNVRLLGELNASNLLQLYLAQKHIWNEVDKYAPNLITMIPGITDDAMTDYAATTALVDKYDHSIQGIPALSGQLHSTTLRYTTDFKNAFVSLRIDIPENDPNGEFFKLARPFSDLLVEGFDNVLGNDTDIPDWTLATIASPGTSNSTFVSDSSKKVDGAFSAKATFDQSFRIQVTKIFDSPQDWQAYNEIDVSIETLTESHGQIRLDILGAKGSDGEYTVLNDPIMLLGVNETTTGFKKFVKDILNIQRDAVYGLRIYTDTSLGWNLNPVVVNIDTIELRNTLFYEKTGFIRFRMQTPQKSQWAAISWDGDLNDGEIKARARTGPNFAVFDQSNSVPFSAYISTAGDNPNVEDNTNIEFEIFLGANSGRTTSPVVRSVTISYITSSTNTGLTIDSTSDFLRASAQKNTRVISDAPHGGTIPGKVLIDGRIDTEDLVYGLLNSAQQTDRFGTPVVGLTGSNLFLSPVQAAQENVIFRQGGINGASHVQRLDDRTYFIADAMNDRVMILDKSGTIVNCLVSNNARNIEGLYPISAIYNPDLNTLFVAWSTNVSFKNVALDKFTINGFGLSLQLSNALDSVSSVQGQNTSLEGGNVTAILLSDAHAGVLETYITDSNISDNRVFLDVDVDAVGDKIDEDNLNFATLAGTRGLPIYVGNIKYIKGIYRPVAASITPSGNWLIGNAKPLLKDTAGSDIVSGVSSSEITSVIEVNPDTGEVVFSNDSVDFSLLTLGGVVEMNTKYVALAGITQDEFPPPSSSTENVNSATLLGGTIKQDTTTTTTSTTNTTQDQTQSESTVITKTENDFSELTKYRGRVKIVEKKSGRVIYDQATSDGTYGADVQLDENDNLVVVEKFFLTDAKFGTLGRGRVVKMDEDGNIYFQYGNTEFEAFNDARVLSNGNIMTSS